MQAGVFMVSKELDARDAKIGYTKIRQMDGLGLEDHQQTWWWWFRDSLANSGLST